MKQKLKTLLVAPSGSAAPYTQTNPSGWTEWLTDIDINKQKKKKKDLNQAFGSFQIFNVFSFLYNPGLFISAVVFVL